MPTTAHEIIITAIGARLGNITLANGYSSTPRKIELGRLEPFSSVDELPRINYWFGSDNIVRNKYGGEQHELDVGVEIFSITDPDDLSIPITASRLGGDIITAVNRAVGAPSVASAASYRLSDLVSALDARNFDYRLGEGQSPWLAVAVQFSVVYQSTLGNPYEVQA